MDAPDEVFPHIATLHDFAGHQPTLDKPDADLTRLLLDGWNIRFASRVLITCGYRLALQVIEHRNVVKLPGGGLQHAESAAQAARREVAEEVGLVPAELHTLGAVVEYRAAWKLVQISQCYRSEVHTEAQASIPTEPGSALLWVDDAAAGAKLVREAVGASHNDYDRRFAIARDTSILDFYAQLSA